MPKISIIIPAYNIGRYFEGTLDTIRKQTFSDYEVVIVDDKSPDNTLEIAQKAAAQDSRIKVFEQERNGGAHLARKAGVSHATGEYAFFLDGDDEIAPDMCRQLVEEMGRTGVDILHFGLTVVGDNGLLERECEAFEAFNNRDIPAVEGDDIVRGIFDETRGHMVDWRVTQRCYKTSLLKKAFEQTTDYALRRSQDGYECFVVSALATTYKSFKQCRGYIYHYGRGISGTSRISAEKYAQYCKHFQEDFEAAYDFAESRVSSVLRDCARGFAHKATEILANDWAVRVAPEEQRSAAKAMARVFGSAVTAREIWRFVRDRAWSCLCDGTSLDAEALRWKDIAESIQVTDGLEEDVRRYTEMRCRAETHLRQLSESAVLEQYENQPIRIFVTTHKEVDKPKSAILQPVQVGPKTMRFPWAFHDDDGDNIAAKNPMYCELTTQYWAWKNINADYYGFCHYRRYFDFSDTVHKENPYGEIMDDYIDGDAVRRYGLDDATMANAIHGYDVITTRFQDLTAIIDGLGTPRKVWEAAPELHDDDLRNMYRILCAMHPDYKEDADAFLNGQKSCFCNMFIMKKEIFFDYCAWLFPLLEEFERDTDMSYYSKEALRTPGHLSERLLNIYLMHHKRIGSNWKTKELQCVHFTNPEQAETLEPLWDADAPVRQPIPVVFAADRNYVPMLTTTIYSMMANASIDRFYDVVVLQKDISWEQQERMRTFFAQFRNMSLRFINVKREVSSYGLTTNNEHISIETYYRFLIQKLLPFYDKVVYLDSDIVINGDVAELFDTELGNDLLAACRDIDYLGNLNVKQGNKRMAYTLDTLGMKDAYAYFQAGVLVLNTAEMRKLHSIREWLTIASNPEYIYNDQDVLNAECEGRVRFLDWEWDVIHDCDGRVGRIFRLAPASDFDAYMASRQNAKIVHYAGFEKPWKKPDCDFGSVYWRYARNTPFYETLLGLVADARAVAHVEDAIRYACRFAKPARAVAENNPLRKIVDPIAPLGSRRREVLKAAGRMMRGRK